MLHGKSIITLITQISIKMEEKPPFYLIIENDDIEMIKLFFFIIAFKFDFDNQYRKYYFGENDKNKKDNKNIVR